MHIFLKMSETATIFHRTISFQLSWYWSIRRNTSFPSCFLLSFLFLLFLLKQQKVLPIQIANEKFCLIPFPPLNFRMITVWRHVDLQKSSEYRRALLELFFKVFFKFHMRFIVKYLDLSSFLYTMLNSLNCN